LRAGARAIERQPLRVRVARACVKALTGGLLGTVEHDRAHHGVGAGPVVGLGGELERSPHPRGVGR